MVRLAVDFIRAGLSRAQVACVAVAGLLGHRRARCAGGVLALGLSMAIVLRAFSLFGPRQETPAPPDPEQQIPAPAGALHTLQVFLVAGEPARGEAAPASGSTKAQAEALSRPVRKAKKPGRKVLVVRPEREVLARGQQLLLLRDTNMESIPDIVASFDGIGLRSFMSNLVENSEARLVLLAPARKVHPEVPVAAVSVTNLESFEDSLPAAYRSGSQERRARASISGTRRILQEIGYCFGPSEEYGLSRAERKEQAGRVYDLLQRFRLLLVRNRSEIHFCEGRLKKLKANTEEIVTHLTHEMLDEYLSSRQDPDEGEARWEEQKLRQDRREGQVDQALFQRFFAERR